MKILNFVFSVMLITLGTFLYTHQRIEAIRTSYEINTKEAQLNKLLDVRKELEYNVASLKAPEYLEVQLAKSDVRMVLPERWQVSRVTGFDDGSADGVMPGIFDNIAGIFSLKSEAQATPAIDQPTTEPY